MNEWGQISYETLEQLESPPLLIKLNIGVVLSSRIINDNEFSQMNFCPVES